MSTKDIIFLRLRLRNFMSYGNSTSTIKLDAGGTTQIQGKNLDETSNGLTSNGTGKSTIVNALVYVMYGEALGDILVDNLINDTNLKNCVVSVDLLVGDTKYTITRYRKMKAGPEGNYIEIFVNDDTTINVAKAGVSDTNEWIVNNIIGMPKELFVRLVVFDADEPSFFKLTAEKQRNVMENLFLITTLSEKATKLKELNKEIKSQLATEELIIKNLESNVQQHKIRLDKATQRVDLWEATKESNIITLTSQLKKLSEVDVAAEKQLIAAYELHMDQLSLIQDDIKDTQQLEKVKKGEVAENSLQLANVKTKKSNISSNIIKNKKEIDGLNKQIETLKQSLCPECGQHLHDAQSSIDNKTAQVNVLHATIESLTIELDKFDSDIAKYQGIDTNLQSELTTIQLTVSEKTNTLKSQAKLVMRPNYFQVSDLEIIQHKIDNIIVDIESQKTQTNPHLEAVQDIIDDQPEIPNYDKINELKKVFDHQTFLIKLLTDKKSFIRRRLIDRRLPLLNARLGKYLKQMGLPYQVEFNSDLSPTIRRRGKNLDFGNLSHGQRARVNFALSFAFRDVLENSSKKVNICILDEVLDKALCGVGTNAAVTMITEKAKEDGISVFVITHKSELSTRFHRIMTVTMEHGFSSIQQ